VGKKRTRKELQILETFENTPRGEVSISAEFDLPLAALALVVKAGWQEEEIRRVLDGLRAAELVALPAAAEPLVALPNSRIADARVVEERLRKAVPKATVGRSLQATRRGRGPARACQKAVYRGHGEHRSYLRPASRRPDGLAKRCGTDKRGAAERAFRAFSSRAPRSELAASGRTHRRELRGRGRTL
jgi:hypothetical protein